MPMLSDGDYIGAAQTYLELCDKTLAFYAQKGEPWDRENDPTQLGKRLLFKIAIVVLLPLLIAGTVCFLFYRQMKTAVQKTEADDYVSENGLVLTQQQDYFTHTTETREYGRKRIRRLFRRQILRKTSIFALPISRTDIKSIILHAFDI